MAGSRPLYEFVGEVPPDLLCGICLLVPHDPHRVSCCGRFFCQLCITEWTNAQSCQCPSCFRPNCSHRSDSSLSQRVVHLPIYCTNRQTGCAWQGLIRDLQLHLSTDEGCFFTLVECPLAEFGCQLRRVQRRDLSKHMADKHSHHMRILLGNLKHTSSRLETQERKMEDLQQRFLLFFSQVSCSLQSLNSVAGKTTTLMYEFEEMKTKVMELEESLLKIRPHSLTHLNRALSDTIPPLYSYSKRNKEDGNMSLNGSLLQGLINIEEHMAPEKGRGGAEDGKKGAREKKNVGEMFSELSVPGDLPTELAGTWEEGEREREREGVTVLAELKERAIEEEEGVACNDSEEISEANTSSQSDVALATEESDMSSLSPSPCSGFQLSSYATAASKPFHPVLNGQHAVSSKCPDSIPPRNHYPICTPVKTDTVTMATVPSAASVAVGIHSNGCHGNGQHMMSHSNDHSNGRHMEQTHSKSVHTESNQFQTSTENPLNRSDFSTHLSSVLGEGLGAIATTGPAGWTDWSEERELCIPRSDSSLSEKSSCNSETSFNGDTVIYYETSPPVVVSTTTGKKSPSPDHTQVKLFVKYMPHCCTPEKAVSLFVAYGRVYLMEYHSEHRDKLFLIMDREGGLQAMSALNGIRLEGSPKPLSVQLYRALPTSSTPVIQRSENMTADKTMRLFVKYLCSESTNEDIAELFGAYGKVYNIQKHPNRRNVAFVYMCQDGGKKAIAHLNGHQSQEMSKPLLVELSHEPATGKA